DFSHTEAANAVTKPVRPIKIILERKPQNMIRILHNASKQARIGLYIMTQNRLFFGFIVSFTDGTTYFCPITLPEPEMEQLTLPGISQEVREKGQKGATLSGSEIEEVLRAIYELSTTQVQIITFDCKEQYLFLQKENTTNYFDVIIASYLRNPIQTNYTPQMIAKEFFDEKLPDHAQVFGKKSFIQIFKDPSLEAAFQTLYSQALYYSLCAYPILDQVLREEQMDHLMTEIEMPLSLVLYDMETEGIQVRQKELHTYSEALTQRITELEKMIYEAAGTSFLIQSPKQLGEILFDKLGLPSGKKTKSGYSTDVDVLEKLAPDYQIAKDVLEYRGLMKLKSTYAEGLVAFIGEDQRIHTHFTQTETRTGRLSSKEPNLQNIPMRTELGRKIRKVFVPKDGYLFMDADYSQIELRVLAHMSGDEQLIEAYRSMADIHKITASQVFHTPMDQVTDIQRRNAKAVNFGIVYGISSFGLSQDLSINRKEAQSYIEKYFATYPKVKGFLDAQVKMAREKGYVETLFGRRRPLPELAAAGRSQRSFGERIAKNSPIQGTAADIIKIAMIKVWKALKESGLESKLILQVHDELLIETKKEEEAQVRIILEENMKGAADLLVALEVDLHTGSNWYEAK
ncbi:MAG: DNA polymerase I, partial [Lachnospiraceae bacterium]|nr:DNA polymerase I [Lachnospiraceae bacterium]